MADMSVIARTLLTWDWMDRARLIEGIPRSPAIGSSGSEDGRSPDEASEMLFSGSARPERNREKSLMDEPPGSRVSTTASTMYGTVIRTLRGFTAKTADEEPKWRKRGDELLTGFKKTW